ncbi:MULTISPECIES: chitobiase/beta-hexosaminidase C-terminal domain-containing protein [Streptomyces]|uniref:chitobiase/beta-hexosaminidase C-terminal domain-containing protein n=1 Tax=Streptomyces TaxID=1883 RepID=UPI001E2C7998|nr:MULTISPECIES: chitobiase/beta-hexosaminidase C-terminal domain-containing protein [Streptomyces]MCZ4102987.1 chitobiase/beta-hexosaminidase C-terminal domain-containing protein [Streptomyces sp. H39-C1]
MRSTALPGRMRPPPRLHQRSVAFLSALVLVLTGLLGLSQLAGPASAAAADYTQSVTQLNATQAQISFTPTTAALYVDVHYLVNSAGQQNVRMANSAGTWTQTVSSLTNGSVLEYWFTYEKSGPQYDTPHFTYTQGGGGTGSVATPTFNPAGGSYTSAQSVTVADATAGASIHYTRDGSTPTAASTLYSAPISVTATTTVKAIAVKSGLTDSAVASATYTIGASAGCPTQSDTPNFGPNVHIYDPSMSSATIQAQLDAQFAQMKDTNTAQFSSNRVAQLFKPGTYAVNDNVGFYTSVAGLGQNPDDVTINGHVTVDAFNASDAGNATQNFWRSAENLAINPVGGNRWAVAQAAPFRRIDVHGDLQLYPASYGWASGGYVADTKVSGQAASISQQQWYTRDSNLGSWAGGVWNMVFSGTTGAPANTFPNPPETTLATTPVSRDVPYLYVDGTGKYRVFLPSLRTNASGASWANGSTPGTSQPMSQFYVVKAGDTAATINNALSQGCNLFVTPGVYHLNQTLNINRANTVVLGIGYPTFVPDNGVDAIQVADVDGVRLKGLLIDAGTTNSAALLTVGPAGSSANHAGNPTTIQDVFFRIGGQIAGKATTSLIVNSNNTIIDHIWAWRADHGNAGTIGWTTNTADTGVIVNGGSVLATGLFVEHYQKHEVIWNGQNGKTIFFQNEMPYDVPNQGAWMSAAGVNGYAAYKVGAGVTTHEAWGLGSYCYFNVNPAVNSYHAFEVPNTPGVRFHDALTVSLGGVGTITHVINDTGALTASNTTPSNVVAYP